MNKVFGFKEANFKASDGKEIEGFNVYIGKTIKNDVGNGYELDRIYLSKAKIAKCDINLEDLLGQSVELLYNKYGKVEVIRVIEE